METHVELRDLESLMAAVESACLCGQALSGSELELLDRVYTERMSLTASRGGDAKKVRTLSCRFWAATQAPRALEALKGLSDAKLRQLACEIFASADAGLSAEELGMLASHWALAGRAWMLIKHDQEALSCFELAATPFADLKSEALEVQNSAQAAILGEVALQAMLWAACIHFADARYAWSFKALEQARDTLDRSRHLRTTSLDEFQRACYEQASAHRLAGNTALALDLLSLALFAAIPEGADLASAAVANPAAQAQLLQQLALCHSDLGEHSLALKFARGSLQLVPNADAERLASAQQALVLILCKQLNVIDNAISDGEILDGQPHQDAGKIRPTMDAAHVMMRDAGIPVDVCLETCAMLLENKLPEALVASCLDDLRQRCQDNRLAQHKVIRYQLHVLCSSLKKHAPGSTSDARWALDKLNSTLETADAFMFDADDEAAEVTRKEVLGHVGELARAAHAAGRPYDAAHWLSLTLNFARDGTEQADCWLTIAAQHAKAKDAQQAQDCINKALECNPNNLIALILALQSAASVNAVGKHDEERVRGLLARVKEHPDLVAQHAALLVHSLHQYHVMEVRLETLEMLAKSLPTDDSAAAMQPKPESASDFALARMSRMHVIAELMRLACHAKASINDLLRYMSQALEGARLSLEQHASLGSEGVAREVHAIIATAWSHAQQLGRDKHWKGSASLLEAAYNMLQLFDEQLRPDLLEAKAWCLAMMAACAVQQAKSESLASPQVSRSHAETAMVSIDRAHQASRRAARGRGASGMKPSDDQAGSGAPSLIGGAAAGANIFVVLVLLEFEVRCMTGDSEVQLKRFADEASSQETVGIKVLLAMAKIATTASMRRLAIHCIQRFLRVLLGTGGAGGKNGEYKMCAAAYREMITLYTSRNETFAIFEGVLQLLGGQASGVVEGYPAEEVAWLVATAWNNGTHFYRLQQYRWAERWLSKGLALAKYCPGAFSLDTMTAHYKTCLQQLSSLPSEQRSSTAD